MSTWVQWVVAAQAATLEVGPDAPFRNIPAAIEQARNGDRIEVHPGRYDRPLYLGDKELVMVSTEGPEVTTIVSEAYYESAITVWGEAPLTLQGFTVDGSGVTGGLFAGGGAVVHLEDLHLTGGPDRSLWVDDSTVTVVGSTFGSSVGTIGSHAAFFRSDVVIEGSTFTKGHAEWGGGGVFAERSNLVVRGCTFADNNGADAGGLMANAQDVGVTTIEDSVFERNEARYGYGGAITQYGGTLTLLRTTLRDNSAEYGGGALDHTGGVLFRFEDGRVEGNTSPTFGAGLGLYDVQETVILRSTIADNTTPGSGGGVFVVGYSQLVEIAGNRFCGNFSGDYGGALWFDTYQPLAADVHHNVFVGNVAHTAGAAIAATNTELDVVQNTIVDTSTGGDRGAVWANWGVSATLVNNAITHSVGAAVRKEPYAERVDARYTLLFGNDRDLVGTASSPTTVAADPVYRDHRPGDCGSDVRPGEGSALVDAGSPNLLDDDGSPSDIGAYGGPGASALMDVDGDGVIDGDCAPFDPVASAPGDEVVADGLDQDCDGTDLCWVDGDGDGTGGTETRAAAFGCAEAGVSPVSGDCDDGDPGVVADCEGGGVEADPAPAGEVSGLPARWFCATGGGSWPGFEGLLFGLWWVGRRRSGG